MQKFMKAIAAIMLTVAVVCAAGCTKPDDSNDPNNGGNDNGGSNNNGVLNGMFSVSTTQQVRFSQGNLQYQASTNTWRFADNQYDYLAGNNYNISATNSGWIDLFGWGTSGYHNPDDPSNVNYQPYSTSQQSNTAPDNYWGYGPSNNMPDKDLTGTSANYDWGVYNAISNGGNVAGRWRTLTSDEWWYVFQARNTNSGICFVKAEVAGVNGVILLPDNWERNTYILYDVNQGSANYSANVIDVSTWNNTFQANGSVFLPAAGERYWTGAGSISGNLGVFYTGLVGNYWSSTAGSSDRDAYCLCFSDYGNGYGYLKPRYARGGYNGFSVRLVCPTE